jgi:hypothetical protein
MRAFHEIASDYCDWIERSVKCENLAEWLPCILAELIHAAFCLHEDDSPDASAEDFQVRECHREAARLPSLPFDHYHEVYHAFDFEEEPVTASLNDDLHGIYGELARGFKIAREVSPTEAKRYWGESFRIHWGEHATGALRALYCNHRNKE